MARNEVETSLGSVFNVYFSDISADKLTFTNVCCTCQLAETVEGLSRFLNDPDETPSSSMVHAVQRHREVLGDYKRDFNQTKVCVIFSAG